MKTLKFSSKLAQNFIRAYQNSSAKFLDDVYKSVSKDKYIAYQICFDLYAHDKKVQPGSFRIISANTFQFTAAWWTIEGLRVETAKNSYLIKELPF